MARTLPDDKGFREFLAQIDRDRLEQERKDRIAQNKVELDAGLKLLVKWGLCETAFVVDFEEGVFRCDGVTLKPKRDRAQRLRYFSVQDDKTYTDGRWRDAWSVEDLARIVAGRV